jgi:hypothetical protein
VCLKTGHTTDRCWHRFEEDFVPEEKHAGAAMNSYTVDNNWYTDTGATDHITGELEKMAVREKYNGGDQVHTANGAGMNIRILVILLFVPLIKILNFAILCMFHPLKRI